MRFVVTLFKIRVYYSAVSSESEAVETKPQFLFHQTYSRVLGSYVETSEKAGNHKASSAFNNSVEDLSLTSSLKQVVILNIFKE